MSDNLYRELFQRSADAILIIEGGRFIDCNDAAVRMLRAHNRDEVLQTHPSELSPPLQRDGRDSRDKANEMIATAIRDGNHRFEWTHRRVDGSDFPVEVLLTTVSEGKRLHVVWRDISDRRRLEEELRHTQKMEAIGKLAAGIAHDFNNLLVGILGHAELLHLELEDQHALAHVAEIRNASGRAADLVEQLMLFARKDTTRATSVFDLGELLVESNRLLERVLGEDVRLDIRLDTAGAHVEADPTQIQQVVMNLATNARDAMPRGGTLTLCLRISETEPKCVELMVTDDGEGMSSDVQQRAFDPFFTTKPVGKGTGLGLATVHGVVDRAGGQVTLRSEPGEGTTFTIQLPLVHDESSPDIDHAPVAAGRGELVMVVEDEVVVSRLVVGVLEKAGYRVVSASNGEQGVAVFERHRDEVELVISDVIMPVMSGPAFLRALAKRGFRPKALLMSGYTGDALERGGLPDDIELLEKPFAPAQLLRLVRTKLDAP